MLMNSTVGLMMFLVYAGHVHSAEILMVTMGGTKSHKIPFWELARGLISRGHNITFLNGFPADFELNGLHEITPVSLVEYIKNYTNWDLLGARMNGEMPISMWDAVRYAFQSCDLLLDDVETKELLHRNFDLAILDGAFPECALALVNVYKIPFMYMNTVGFYTGSLSMAGNPTPFSITPNFFSAFTDEMNVVERALNTGLQIFSNMMHRIVIRLVYSKIQKHLGYNAVHPYELSKNVSFILQNGHATVSYPRPFNPNVAEVACIHCRPAGPLPNDLESFINSSDNGFIYVSMGSSVKASNMPEKLRKMLVKTFALLPYNVLWKWEDKHFNCDIPSNVMLSRWLPQQDILGHKKLRAFITHGGLLSMYETVFHGVPVVTMPVFCDHDVNSAKAEVDGYAIKLHLETLTTDQLYKAILKVIHDPTYKTAARARQRLLRDQRSSPLDTAVYWTEYVLRHNGAYHLQTPARNLSWMQYYLLDVALLYFIGACCIFHIVKRILRHDVIDLLHKKHKKL